jgi:glycosyltransferase involved in cell wall biosynthesis
MKICMLTRTYPPRIGGPGSLIYRLSKALTEKGFDITVITQKIRGAPKFEIKDGVKVHRAYCLSDTNEFTFANLAVGISAFTKKVLENKNNDVFHAHDISVAGFSGCIAKRFIRKPFFLKYGGDLVFEYLSLKKFDGWNPRDGLEGTLRYKGGFASVLHKIQSWYFRTYDLILPDSEYGREYLVNRLGLSTERVRAIPNGIDDVKFSPRNSKKYKTKLGLEGNIIFTAARLVQWKGIDVIIKSMPKILKHHDAKLLIAGDGPLETVLARLIKQLDLEKDVRLIGKVMADDMAPYLNACDVFVLHSYFDTSPNVLLEAMASGKPCIVSDIKGIREVVKNDSAIRVPIGDSDKLADAITPVLENEEIYNQLSKKARKRIEEKYSWKRVVKKYTRLYEDAAEGIMN